MMTTPEQYKKHREKIIEDSKAYAKKNKDKINKRRRNRYAEDKDFRVKTNEINNKRYHENKEEINTRRKQEYQLKKLKEEKELLETNLKLKQRTKLHDLIDDFVKGHDEVNEKAEELFEKFLTWMNIKDKEMKN